MASSLSFVIGETVNCSPSKLYFGNVLQRCCAQKGQWNFGGYMVDPYKNKDGGCCLNTPEFPNGMEWKTLNMRMENEEKIRMRMRMLTF